MTKSARDASMGVSAEPNVTPPTDDRSAGVSTEESPPRSTVSSAARKDPDVWLLMQASVPRLSQGITRHGSGR